MPAPRNDGEWFTLLILLCGMAWLLLGCANLRDKSFGAAGTISAVKIESSGGANTGTILPNVLVGGAALAVATSPASDPRSVYAGASRSSILSKVFGLGVEDSACVYISAPGETASETAIRLQALTRADSERAALMRSQGISWSDLVPF
jgi:hypothetical protein